ncbi:MAG: thioredoxin family protein [Saprospiraceae bacterium]|nr:thioredoxin family protein [Saprospiraceae bacterium]
MNDEVKHIVVFGANCGKCKKAEALIRSVISKLQLQADVTKCEDWDIMVQHNVTYLPTIMIDNVIKFKGVVPAENELIRAIN